MWERRCDDSTCSRMRCVSQLMHRLTHCFREQARSHILIVFPQLSPVDQFPRRLAVIGNQAF